LRNLGEVGLADIFVRGQELAPVAGLVKKTLRRRAMQPTEGEGHSHVVVHECVATGKSISTAQRVINPAVIVLLFVRTFLL